MMKFSSSSNYYAYHTKTLFTIFFVKSSFHFREALSHQPITTETLLLSISLPVVCINMLLVMSIFLFATCFTESFAGNPSSTSVDYAQPPGTTQRWNITSFFITVSYSTQGGSRGSEWRRRKKKEEERKEERKEEEEKEEEGEKEGGGME